MENKSVDTYEQQSFLASGHFTRVKGSALYAAAELAGAILADGNVQDAHISLWGHHTEDQEYYDTHLSALCKIAFGFHARPHLKKSNRVYGFYICDPRIIDFVVQVLNVPEGKKTYTARVPEIVRSTADSELKKRFIRGLFDCDGGLSFRRRGSDYRPGSRAPHTYPQIKLGLVAHQLVDDVSQILDEIGIPHNIRIQRTKRPNEADVKVIEIYGRQSLELWMQKIGFKNPVQTTRHQMFLKYGYNPPGTTLRQRKAMLKGTLHPREIYQVP